MKRILIYLDFLSLISLSFIQVDEKQNSETIIDSPHQLDSHLHSKVDELCPKSNPNDIVWQHLDANYELARVGAITQVIDQAKMTEVDDVLGDGIHKPVKLPENTEDDAQGILDEHFSRIWADERNEHMCSRKKRNESSHTSVSRASTTRYPYTHDALSSTYDDPAEQDGRKRASGRRRTAVSAVASLTCNTDTVVQDCSQRRRNSYRGNNRPNRSDARSTASWDSGVVANCTTHESRFGDNNNSAFGEVETGSIVAAASLQALSSSTTELAVVNGEVTAKLVEHMIRHYPRRYETHSFDQNPPSHVSVYRPSEFCQSHFHKAHLNRIQGVTCDVCNARNKAPCMVETYRPGMKNQSESVGSCCSSSCGNGPMNCNQYHCFHTCPGSNQQNSTNEKLYPKR